MTGIGGAGCRTTWQKVRTGAVLALAGAWLLACFGSADVWAQGMTLDICPTDYGSFPENAPALTCGCSAAAVEDGAPSGAPIPYYYQSGLCRAALHAGAIGAERREELSVQPEEGDRFFSSGFAQRRGDPAYGPRHGLSGGRHQGNLQCLSRLHLRVLPARRHRLKRTGMTLDTARSDYGSFPEDAPPLTCGCSAATVKDPGTVWGANPYYYQSGLCRAAVHAGAIGAEGRTDCGPAPGSRCRSIRRFRATAWRPVPRAPGWDSASARRRLAGGPAVPYSTRQAAPD